jgi:hemerythrin-like domain-containing protein
MEQSNMSQTTRELKEMMGEHEGIRAHMKFLLNSLEGLENQPMHVKDRIWTYRWGLLDFRAAVLRHIELDKSIYKTFEKDSLVKETEGEHEEIVNRIDEVIRLANEAVDYHHPPQDLTRRAKTIRQAFEQVCTMIESHTSKEDRMWMYVGEIIGKV